jgi:peptidoglycan biosynthesis protein MviN/MurJ (putative lipid II flippase)
MQSIMSKILIIIGIVLIVIGLIWAYAPWLINWFGNLPGDIRINKENMKIFFPITSSIVISILLTIILNLIRKFFQ